METNTLLFPEGNDLLSELDIKFPWRSITVIFYFLLMADAKERELLMLRKLQSPTWIRFVFYEIWLATALLASDNLSNKTQLYNLGLVILMLSWASCWAWHMTQTSVLLAVIAFCCGAIEAAAFPQPEMLLWAVFLLFHTCALARFHHSRLGVPLADRPISRFTGPDVEVPQSGYIVLQDPLPILVSQKTDV